MSIEPGLKNYCSVCNLADDGFIGIRFQDGLPHISFPRGYRLCDEEDDIRKDILCLIAVLRRFSNRREGCGSAGSGGEQTAFPVLAYQYIIRDFLAHGYYTEQETEYGVDHPGRIDWKRTIQQVRPQADRDNAVYLHFVSRCNTDKTDMLTRIHEFCVYESFFKLGWLYFSVDYLPKKPVPCTRKKMYLAVLRNALRGTFNSERKRLLSSMIAVVNCAGEQAQQTDFQFGVSHFEYVWEDLIDYVFGGRNKNKYFPRARWHILARGCSESSALEPDTVMEYNEKVYLLDAKYYKFGITGLSAHLPATSSIQKQITYGEYVAAGRFAGRHDIYNAFIMPYAAQENDGVMKCVSVGTADWITYSPETENYKYVLGILLDTKYIMTAYTGRRDREIGKMSRFIEDAIRAYRAEHA